MIVKKRFLSVPVQPMSRQERMVRYCFPVDPDLVSSFACSFTNTIPAGERGVIWHAELGDNGCGRDEAHADTIHLHESLLFLHRPIRRLRCKVPARLPLRHIYCP